LYHSRTIDGRDIVVRNDRHTARHTARRWLAGDDLDARHDRARAGMRAFT
jgi:hypothetical protein